MRRAWIAGLLPLAAAVAGLFLAAGVAGCGGSDATAGGAAQLPAAGGGGVLGYALDTSVASVDPLGATSADALLPSAQIHEPLVERLRPPYGKGRSQPGLALDWRPSRDGTVWTFELRPRVRFQDGSRFNAKAVLANARRWQSEPAGRRLLPGLFAVDAPRPSEVRFQLERPDPRLPRRLASPRLGIVAPGALRRSPGGRIALGRQTNTGSGPFIVSSQMPELIGLSRNTGWWGTAVGLGPSLDGIRFTLAADASERLELLRAGEVQVAENLDRATARRLSRDPLLTAAGPPTAPIGLERSVRGLRPGRVEPLSSVWLTNVREVG